MDIGGRKIVIPTLEAWKLKDRTNGDPNATVVERTRVGGVGLVGRGASGSLPLGDPGRAVG